MLQGLMYFCLALMLHDSYHGEFQFDFTLEQLRSL